MKDTRIKEKNLLTYSSTVNIYMYNYKKKMVLDKPGKET